MYDRSGKIVNVAKGESSEEIIKKHSNLVKKIASQLKSRLPDSVEINDLIQIGMLGLIDAISRYQEGHGAQFSTYAQQRIKGNMLDYLRSVDPMPRNLRKDVKDIELAVFSLQHELGRQPSDKEIAEKLEISIEELNSKLSSSHSYQLIYYEDIAGGEGEGDAFLERFAVDDDKDPLNALLSDAFKESLHESIDDLPDREKKVLQLYYVEELNFKEIGAVLDVCESRICQLHSSAILRIRARLKDESWIGAA